MLQFRWIDHLLYLIPLPFSVPFLHRPFVPFGGVRIMQRSIAGPTVIAWVGASGVARSFG
jgi:hypothetical protein